MSNTQPNLYFCKLSTDYPEQLEKDFYAGGPEGSSWYNGIQPGTFVFVLYMGKLQKLWRAKEYSKIENEINRDGVLIFETIKVYNPPISVVSEFLFFKYFILDLNLLNKSSKQTLKGFYPLTLTKNDLVIDAIDFFAAKRKIYISRDEDFSFLQDQDIVVLLDNDSMLTLKEIRIKNNDTTKIYEPLTSLFKNKYSNETCEIVSLYESAKSQNRVRRRDYLEELINWLKENTTYEVKNPVAFYDHILSGNRKEGNIKRFWAGGVLWEEDDMTSDFISKSYWRIGYSPEDKNGAQSYELISQIKTGDRFALKKWGGHPQLRIYSIGTVTAVSAADEGMIKIAWDKKPSKLFEGAAPKGEGAGNWRRTLVEVRRHDIVKDIFNEDIAPLSRGNDGKLVEEIPFYPAGAIRIDGTDPVLGVRDLAADLAQVIGLTKGEPGNMVGIFGRWGRGKTYFFEQLWTELQKKNEFSKTVFHAWKYQDTTASWAYLYETIADAYFNEPGRGKFLFLFKQPIWWLSLIRKLKLNYKRLNKIQLYSLLIAVTASVIAGFAAFNKVTLSVFLKYLFPSLAIGFGGLAVLPQIFSKYKAEAKSLFKKYTNRLSYANLLGFQAEIHKELKILLKLWFKNPNNHRLLLFVDDIDRCKEDRIIEIVDALRVMLEDKDIMERIVVVAAVDERLLQRAIKIKYKELLDKENSKKELYEMVREYLDKLFITGVKLNELSEAEVQEVYLNHTEKHAEPRHKTKENSIDLSGQIPYEGEIDDDDFEDDDREFIEVAGNKQYELTSLDNEALLESVKLCNGITPRQIRVIYYRFIFAKRLILMKTRNTQMFKVFNELDPKLLTELLCISSESEDSDWFITKKKEILKEEGKNSIIKCRTGEQIEVSKQLLAIVINSLETVVAY